MGGSSPSNVTQTTKTELSPEQKKLFDLAFPYAEQYAGTPVQQYSGSGVAGFNPLETQAQGQYLQQAGNIGDLASKSAESQKMLLDPGFQLDVAHNPYLQAATQSMTDQVTNNLQNKILPGVRSGGTAAGGMYSGASTKNAITTGQAIGDTNRGLSDSITKMMFDAYTGGKSSMQQAVNQNQGVQAQQLIAPSITDAVGGQQRGMEQALLDEQIKKFYTDQKLPLLQAQELMGFVGAMPGGQTTSNVQGAQPQANPLMQTGGVLASLLGLFL